MGYILFSMQDVIKRQARAGGEEPVSQHPQPAQAAWEVNDDRWRQRDLLQATPCLLVGRWYLLHALY